MDWDGFVGWCGKYAPSLFLKAERYQRMGIRDPLMVGRIVKLAFWEYRKPYADSFEANLGIAMAPNSQSFSFRDVVMRLSDGQG